MKKLLAGMLMFRLPHSILVNGAGSIFNISGTPVKSCYKGGSADDVIAVKSDWYAVGNYLRSVISYG